jgi:hypothetical protein
MTRTAAVAPLALDLDLLVRELTACSGMTAGAHALLDTHPSYRPTLRVDVDPRMAWLAAAFDRLAAERGQGRVAWTPVYRDGGRLPACVFETAAEAAQAWAQTRGMRRTAGLADALLAAGRMVRIAERHAPSGTGADEGPAYYVVPELSGLPVPEAADAARPTSAGGAAAPAGFGVAIVPGVFAVVS